MNEIKALQEQIAKLQSENKELFAKLAYIEDAFKYAGEAEISGFKAEISRRLSLDYNKFMYVKSKTPDMDYYEILVYILDYVFRILKKNGIKFDYSEAYKL